MNTKLVLAAVGIAAMVDPATIATLPALAQNMTMGDNMTMDAEIMTAGDVTGAGGNCTK